MSEHETVYRGDGSVMEDKVDGRVVKLVMKHFNEPYHELKSKVGDCDGYRILRDHRIRQPGTVLRLLETMWKLKGSDR